MRTGGKIFWLMLCLASAPARADTTTEIQHLLATMGQSDCAFIRNGKAHSATEAESHLRMKYRKGKSWARSAEQFIARIASHSSWSGKPYFIECPGADPEPAGDWLSTRLEQYRGK